MDEVTVLGTNMERFLHKVKWHVPAQVQIALLRLEAGTTVEVLRDDGTVVRTKTRSTPWCAGQDTTNALVSLVGFSGGHSLTRVRPEGWSWRLA